MHHRRSVGVGTAPSELDAGGFPEPADTEPHRPHLSTSGEAEQHYRDSVKRSRWIARSVPETHFPFACTYLFRAHPHRGNTTTLWHKFRCPEDLPNLHRGTGSRYCQRTPHPPAGPGPCHWQVTMPKKKKKKTQYPRK